MPEQVRIRHYMCAREGCGYCRIFGNSMVAFAFFPSFYRGRYILIEQFVEAIQRSGYILVFHLSFI